MCIRMLIPTPLADFLDVAVNTIRENGGSMLASELVKTLDAREGDHGGIDREGTWMERKLTGTR